MLLKVSRTELVLGATLDLALGDPPWLPHPIRALGLLAKHTERFWRATNLPLRLAGSLFWFTVVGAAVLTVRLTEPRANIYWIYSFLACRDLDRQAIHVIKALETAEPNFLEARHRLSRIVGRDTANLPPSEIVRAVIETVAENASDGVIAPLFFLALAGPAGMALYKAANTLDSTVGYRDERYRDFGWWSARADDVLNFIPARLTALLTWAVALLPGFHARNAIRVTCRDAHTQPSPNAGYPEAAFAGALNIQLGGLNWYGGKPSRKPTLGDPHQPLTATLYPRVRTLLYTATALFLGLLCCSPGRERKRCL